MAIDFPASPNANQTFTVGSITYKWDGAKWIGLGVTPADRLVEGSNSLELDANNDLVYTAPGTLKVNSADAAGYIAEFNQTNASNSGQILINSPTDGNSRPSLMDFARGGTVKFSVGMGYNDANNGFLISAGGSLASNITNAVFRITPDGKTGIGNYAANGTEIPTSLLHVNTNWDNGDVPMVHFKGANNEAPQSGTENISFQISDENSNVLHKVWNTGGGNNDFGYVSYSGNMAVGDNFTPDSALEVRDSAATGVIIRCTNTQTTDSNKALRIRNNSGSNTFSISHKGLISVNGADGTSADTALFRNTTSGGDNRVRINTVANGGGDPYIKFDAGGSNMIVGEYYNGTTNNKLVLGVGETPSAVQGLSIDGNGNGIYGNGHQSTALAVDSDSNRGLNFVTGGRIYCKTDDHWDFNLVGGGLMMRFRNGNDNGGGASQTVVGNITINASSVDFNTTQSDSRLKKNIEPWSDGVLQHFKTLQPKKFHFNWQSDEESLETGYIAQDLVDAFPEAYPLCKTEIDGEEVDRYSFNPSGMVKYLMKALQEEIVKREALEARLDAGGL